MLPQGEQDNPSGRMKERALLLEYGAAARVSIRLLTSKTLLAIYVYACNAVTL